MYKAWHTLKRGLNTEFHVHVHRTGGDLRKWLEENLHLRPDVIRKAMPESSGMAVSPQENAQQLCWVVWPPSKAINGTLTPLRNVPQGLYNRRKYLLYLDRVGRGPPTKRQKKEMKAEGKSKVRKMNEDAKAEKRRIHDEAKTEARMKRMMKELKEEELKSSPRGEDEGKIIGSSSPT
jgi:hypothetical protein